MITPRARTNIVLFVLFAAAAAVTACGGGGGNAPTPATLPTVNPVTTAMSTTTPKPGSTPTATPKTSATPVGGVQTSATLAPIPYGPGENGWAPYSIANAFQFPVQAGFNGNGMTLAVINDYPPSASDLSAFLTQFEIQRVGTYRVENVDGGSPQTDQSGLLESTLDVETALLYDLPAAELRFVQSGRCRRPARYAIDRVACAGIDRLVLLRI